MTSRVSFYNLFISNIKRRIWVIAIMLLILLVLGPLILLTSYENSGIYLTQNELIQNMISLLAPKWYREFVYTALFAVVIAFTEFSYVFSKKQLDLYHSVPVKREKMFLAQYVSGLTIQISLMIVMLITFVLSAVIGKYLTLDAWKNICLTFFGDIVLFLYFYNVAILAIMLTGNLIVGLMGTAVLTFLFPAIVGVIDSLMNYCFVTHYFSSNIMRGLSGKYYFLSPVSSLFRYITDCTEPDYIFTSVGQVIIYLLVVLLFSAIVFGIAFYIYKIRKTESAGISIAIKESEPFIRIPIVILGGLFCVIIMSGVMSEYLSGWVWFSLISGCVFTHFIMEMIINIDYKAFFKNWLQMLVSVAVCFVIFAAFAFDFTKYDTYIPKKSDISKATVIINGIDNDINYMVLNSDEEGIVSVDYCGKDKYMYRHIFTNPELIEKIYEISLKGIEHVDDMKAERVQNGLELSEAVRDVYYGDNTEPTEHGHLIIKSPDDNTDGVSYAVIFELKNGKTVARQYRVPLPDIKNEITEVYSTEDYKTALFDIYDAYDNGFITKVDVMNQFSEKQISVTRDDATKFLDIYLDELKKSTVSDISGPPIGVVSPRFMTSYGYEDGLYGYYIYPGFKKTIEYINKLNPNVDSMTEYADPSEVQNIIINAYGYVYDDEKQEDVTVSELTYSANDSHGKEMIDLICSKAKLSSYSWSNAMFLDKEERLEIVVYYGMDGGIQKSSSVYLRKGEIPEKLNEDIINYAYEH